MSRFKRFGALNRRERRSRSFHVFKRRAMWNICRALNVPMISYDFTRPGKVPSMPVRDITLGDDKSIGKAYITHGVVD
jgi:hypothetical protein